jgi:tight adherence protein B
MDTSTIIVYGSVFLVFFLLVEGIYFLVADFRQSRTRQMNRRMSMLAEGRTSRDVMLRLRREQRFDPARNIVNSMLSWLDDLLAQSGLVSSMEQFLIICSVFVVAALGGLFLLGNLSIFTAIPAIILPFILPVLILMWLRSRRIAKFTAQLPETVDVIVRALRAGHPISAALGLAASELPDPIGSEFGLAVDEMQYGLDLNEALVNMERRVGSPDLRMLVISVQIQNEIGGNLAEILSSISKVIRDRFKIKRKARALSAEGRFSALVLGCLPPAVFGVVTLIAGDYYTAVEDDPVFYPVFGFGIGLMLFGYVVMYKMTNFKI